MALASSGSLIAWYDAYASTFHARHGSGIGRGSLLVVRALKAMLRSPGPYVPDAEVDAYPAVAGVKTEDQPFARLTLLTAATLLSTDAPLRVAVTRQAAAIGSAARAVHPDDFLATEA